MNGSLPQSLKTTTYHSKILGCLCVIEWGLRDIVFLSPSSFEAEANGKRYTFHACIIEHFNTMVDIPVFEEDFLVMCIANKSGDNTIVLTHDDCKEVMGTSVDFHWVAGFIKKRMSITVTNEQKQPTDLLR